MDKFNFNISLSILNHLGRNLYRNFITVIGEAISNSWDADATNVWITIDKERQYMSILDDGEGMTEQDFQNRFLKIGYSKRKNNNIKSAKGRPYIGRKGIGKLALLSCAKKIHVATKTLATKPIGGVIDNADLDKAITDDLNSQEYILQPISVESKDLLSTVNKGTAICFEEITDEIVNTIEYIKKSVALSFKFSLLDTSFNIFVNGELITCKLLKDLAQKTQFVWIINDCADSFLDKKITAISPISIKKISSALPIMGYIATTEKPADIKIRGTDEKVTLDLFVNGRVREKDLFKHISTARIVENYAFGQIHYDALDTGTGKDVFTSSREGIVSNDPDFVKLIDEVKKLFYQVIEDWDKLRLSNGADGDPDNPRIPPKARKARELFSQTCKDMGLPTRAGAKVSVEDPVPQWVAELSDEAQFNIPSYAECFVSENLLRKYITYKNMPLSKEALEQAKKFRNRENDSKNAANISYQVRQSNEDIYYLDMDALANLIDKDHSGAKDAALSRSATIYKPLRDSVGHTSLLTKVAKTQLTVEYNNIQARVATLIKSIGKNPKSDR